MIPVFFRQHAILIQRLWQAVAGCILVAFITHYLSLDEQGWYYSFISLSSSYAIFELGLSVVILQLSAHYSINNRWLPKGRLVGENRLYFISLLSQSFRLYTKLGIGFLIVMIPFGIIFFGHNSENLNSDFNWCGSWIILILATTLNIFVLPFFAAVEGSGSIVEIYCLRILQGVFGSIGCWLMLVMGKSLWAASIYPLISFLVAILWFLIKKPILIRDVLRFNQSHIKWLDEVWPLQWRIGLTWLSSYLLTQIYTPILFYYHGPLVAGQMGLSLTLANMLGLLSQSWIARKIPIMTQAVSQKDWQKFDKIFSEDFKASLLFYLFGMLVFSLLYKLILDTSYSKRILSFWPFIGLFVIVLINHINSALAAHLRSYKKEPLVWVSLAGTALTLPIAWIFAANYSIYGVVTAILIVQLLLTLPLSIHLWLKYNSEWRDR